MVLLQVNYTKLTLQTRPRRRRTQNTDPGMARKDGGGGYNEADQQSDSDKDR